MYCYCKSHCIFWGCFVWLISLFFIPAPFMIECSCFTHLGKQRVVVNGTRVHSKKCQNSGQVHSTAFVFIDFSVSFSQCQEHMCNWPHWALYWLQGRRMHTRGPLGCVSDMELERTCDGIWVLWWVI